MVAISYFFYKLFLIDFIQFIVSSVYTKEVMPPKRARVLAECAIANIMRFMEQYDNNDSVTVMMVESLNQ
jgi:malonyl CoA-acyl carrier protein transacylase